MYFFPRIGSLSTHHRVSDVPRLLLVGEAQVHPPLNVVNVHGLGLVVLHQKGAAGTLPEVPV